MKLDELLPLLKGFDAVLVTGPQRSGTTIAARIIAKALGYRYADEAECDIHDPYKADALLVKGQVVLQAPGLSCYAQGFTCAVVFMYREIDAIRRSEDRIGWREAYGGANFKAEQTKYDRIYHVTGDNIALVKYYVWEAIQRGLCEHPFELDYESLKDSPLWVEKEERTTFTDRQWQKD